MRHLENENGHNALASFDREEIAASFQNLFPDIVVGDIALDWEGEGSYFHVSYEFGPAKRVFCISVSCGYLLLDSPDTMNKIIDACNNLGCALYDPQVGRRFEQPW